MTGKQQISEDRHQLRRTIPFNRHTTLTDEKSHNLYPPQKKKKDQRLTDASPPQKYPNIKFLTSLKKKKKQFISQPFRIYDKDKRCPIATPPPSKTYFLSFTASENPINN